MTSTAAPDQDALVLALTDRDVAEDLPGLRWNVLQHVLGGRRDVVVDLDGVRALSSTAIAALLNIHRLCRARGGRLVLQHPSGAVLDVLAHTGLDRVLVVRTGSGPAPAAPSASRPAAPRQSGRRSAAGHGRRA